MRLRSTTAVLLALLLLVLPSRGPVVSALTGETVPGVGLRLEPAYLVFAPLWGIFDYLTARTVSEHLAILSVVGVAFVAWRLLRTRSPRSMAGRILVEGGAALGFLATLLAFYGAGVLAPRPMAALHVEDPEVVVVDFHSHTDASHDGRPGFTTERNRAWHRGAGFDVAWITDHDSIRPAEEAMARNPERAGDGTVLLPGREVVYAGQHVVALGDRDPREGADPGSGCAGWPVLIQTLPNDLGRVHPGGCSEAGGGVVAIELVDGDPRGLAQGEDERDRVLALADSLELVLVSASNLHGWGRTSVSWNLIRVPGWRTMAPAEVGVRIEEVLRARGRDAVQVVSVRRPPVPLEGRVGAAAASLLSLADFAVRRSRLERLSWLFWIGAAVALVRYRRDRGERAVSGGGSAWPGRPGGPGFPPRRPGPPGSAPR